MTPVPFLDLDIQHGVIAEEIAEGFHRVLQSKGFVLGPEVSAFEEAFAAFSGVSECVGVGNGTDALELALRACGITYADEEVILPANTFVATAEAVVRAGARPVFVDVDRGTALIDAEGVQQALSARTRAVIGVDLYGQVAPFEALEAALSDRDVTLVEDAAQSHGASRNGVRAGGFGVIAATSFYPGKNLGAYGDGGAVLTGSPELATTLRSMRNHGGEGRYRHDIFGVNSRLDGLQAVVLRAKLAHLDRWNHERCEAARCYATLLQDVRDIAPIETLGGNEHVFHLYVVTSPKRDELIGALERASIGTGIHYPSPVHLLPPFRDLGSGPGSCPVAETLAQEILSLPMFPGITAEQQERVVEVLRSVAA